MQGANEPNKACLRVQSVFLRACEAVRVYISKNGRISEISEKFSSSIRCAELPQFDAAFGSTDSHQKPLGPPPTVPDPTVTVRGLDVTVAVQDKYARMLVLQGHCPLVLSQPVHLLD